MARVPVSKEQADRRCGESDLPLQLATVRKLADVQSVSPADLQRQLPAD